MASRKGSATAQAHQQMLVSSNTGLQSPPAFKRLERSAVTTRV